MSTRRRVGFSNTTSEASRRQLMQPVPCWEKVWVLPDNAGPGSTLKIYKWVKTEKKQQFSDDENETDQPLAPLPEPDEVEVVDGDEEIDQDEANTSIAPETAAASRDVSEMPIGPKDDALSKPGTPKPHPLSMSFMPEPDVDDALDDLLKPREGELDAAVGADGMGDMGGMTLDMSGVGPDGEPFEGATLSQLQSDDALLGAGGLMDSSMDDPFAPPSS
ncbi:uncharacterized protein B0H18DRAFT_1121264 [Fomitopsis serialis]|uniref:uncharacterized protein n=1 Tax=Fomitopsis serialis TaxID=139415 RepID=UPI00200809F7|nr:uncharacterized protein B0H18DRAFT_1121264 [Neoantrodia serialis]KAH9921808.1 hypothetical protein B0H18DRAFT_1121264 [Neoantrodia serialis]